MSDIETLVTAPVIVAVIVGGQTVLRGRDGGGDIVLSTPPETALLSMDPLLMLCGLAAFLTTGALLIGLEMRAEGRERRAGLAAKSLI